MPKLGVNIDHVATIREARKTYMPDPVEAALECEKAGCDSIVCHLREDRRHIKDLDVLKLRKAVRTSLNLEMSIAKDIVDFARRVRPEQATLVPERRREVTTEGGLDVSGNLRRIEKIVSILMDSGIAVSLFINPQASQIDASAKCGAGIIELHTGEYADAGSEIKRRRRLGILKDAVDRALALGLEVNAGHGLNYENVKSIAVIKGINELNIGHAIVSRSVSVGIAKATEEMLGLIR